MKIDINTHGQNQSDLIYTRGFEAPSKSHSTFELRGLDQKFISYVVFQLHAFYFNVTMSLGEKQSGPDHQNGTSLGFILKPSEPVKTLHLWNHNFDEVHCMVAIVIYNQSAPSIGGCNMEGNVASPNLSIQEKEHFIIVQTPLAKLSNELLEKKLIHCGDNTSEPMQYLTLYTYLEQLNFHRDVYFEGIKNLLFTSAFRNGHQVRTLKQVHTEKLHQFFYL